MTSHVGGDTIQCSHPNDSERNTQPLRQSSHNVYYQLDMGPPLSIGYLIVLLFHAPHRLTSDL
jgi:hypothetical protein